MSDEDRPDAPDPDQERPDVEQEGSDEQQPVVEGPDEERLFPGPSDSSKAEDPTASKWAFGKGQASRFPRFSLPNLSGKVRLPKLPERFPKLSEKFPKLPEKWPKLPGNLGSWALGAALFVVVLLIYGLIANLTGGGTPAARPQVRRPTPAVSPPPATPTRACEQPSLIATVETKTVAARTRPAESAKVIKKFGRKSVLGAPQVFLIEEDVTGPAGDMWFKVLLPVRPNGTRGYIPASDVSVSKTLYRLKVERKKFSVSFYEGCEQVKKFKVGIGTGQTPTPVGDFYLQALYKLPNPNTVYGTYAYALSGYSDVITDWKFGGIIGLHGTNNPEGSIGRYVSHGCIRMRNQDVESLVDILPLGTPIEIV